MTDEMILQGFCAYDAEITRKYFYGYCRNAYQIYDFKYQLKYKEGLDFYSLAHDYYIHLMIEDFSSLLRKPRTARLSSWMAHGFHYVVLDALKAYNKEYKHQVHESSDAVLAFVRSAYVDDEMLLHVADAVANHYHDRVMSEIAHMVIYAGFKQNEVAQQLNLTPAAVNQRYKRMMQEVVVPFVIENYGKGQYVDTLKCVEPVYGIMCLDADSNSLAPYIPQSAEYCIMENRITPRFVSSLQPNEVFVFGSNLQGIHAGGAARMARLSFGAVMGVGVGLQGRSYAIPTMPGGVDTIRPYVDEFIAYAARHPEQIFLVTPIGCGIAGFDVADIAPLFRAAPDLDNVHLPAEFWGMLL